MHETVISLWTHLCLILLSRQPPHTMPAMSSTPRAPATTPLRNRPTAVTLIGSVFAGQLFASASTCGRVTVTVSTQEVGGH